MAEIIGLAASIIAIGAAAGTACKVANTLYRLAKKIKAAAAEITEFARKISQFSSIISSAHIALEEHLQYLLSSKVLQFMDKSQVVAELGAESKNIADRSKSLMEKIRAIGSDIDIWTKFQWVRKRSEVKAFGPEMESIKTSLTVVMQILTLDALKQRPMTPEIEIKIKRLEKQVDVQVKTIEMLQQTVLRRSKRRHIDQAIPQNMRAMQDDLIALGSSMVRNGTVPSVSSRSTSSASFRTSSGSYLGSLPSVRRTRGTSASRVRTQSPLIRSLAVDINDTTRQQVATAPASAVSQAEESSTGPAMTVPDVPNTSRSPPVAGPTQVREVPISPQSDGDYVGVYASSKQIQLDSDENYSSISGFITTPSGPVSVDAIFSPNMEECLISRSFATRLGLEIHPLEQADRDVVVRYQNGQQENILGKLRIEWTGVDVGRAFRVRCLVWEGNIPRQLMLGRPFVEKRRHYREGNSSAV